MYNPTGPVTALTTMSVNWSANASYSCIGKHEAGKQIINTRKLRNREINWTRHYKIPLFSVLFLQPFSESLYQAHHPLPQGSWTFQETEELLFWQSQNHQPKHVDAYLDNGKKALVTCIKQMAVLHLQFLSFLRGKKENENW